MPRYAKRTTGFKRKRYGRKSTKKPTTKPKRRIYRRPTRRRTVSRIPRLVSDLQYGAKRPPVFRTKYSDMRTFRVTPRHSIVGTGTPATMMIRLADLGGSDLFNPTNGFWKPLQFSAKPDMFEKLGKFYDAYHVVGAKVSVTVKPLLGNTAAHDGHNFLNQPKINDEGVMLVTVGTTDTEVWPKSATTPDELTKYPRSRSHTSIYKRQEAQIAAPSMLDANGNELNPNHGKAISMSPGERGKQLSFTTTYSPRRLYGQKATTNGFLRTPLLETAIGHVNSQQQQYAFIDIREFECAPLNAVIDAGNRDWTMTPDCLVTVRVDYVIQVSDPVGIGGNLLDSRTQIINSAEVAEYDTPLQDGSGGDMDVPEP